MEMIILMEVKTNCYYHYNIDTLHEEPSPVPDKNETRISVFMARTIQMHSAYKTNLQTSEQQRTSFTCLFIATQ